MPILRRMPARETMAGLEVGRETVAYPFSQLRIARVVNDRVGGLPIVIVHQRSSDTTTAFEAGATGRVLTFQAANGDGSSVIDLDRRAGPAGMDARGEPPCSNHECARFHTTPWRIPRGPRACLWRGSSRLGGALSECGSP